MASCSKPGPLLPQVIAGIAALAAEGPLVIVHGGGREIDAETARRNVPKNADRRPAHHRRGDARGGDRGCSRGTINTRLVAALVASGVPAVGLTGVDAGIGLSMRAPAHKTVDGQFVDLGLVGQPSADRTPTLVLDLLSHGYVPAIACLGVELDGDATARC